MKTVSIFQLTEDDEGRTVNIKPDPKAAPNFAYSCTGQLLHQSTGEWYVKPTPELLLEIWVIDLITFLD